MKNLISFSIIICTVFLCTTFAHAQSQSLGQINQMLPLGVDLEIIPPNPGPNESVSATIGSFDTDLDSATVTWSVNGKVVKSAKGLKDFTFTTGNMNTTTNLSVTVRSARGESVTKTFSFRPASVDLLWQTTGYTPPFYKGKALFSYQNKIQFIALPHITVGGREVPPENLIYNWTKNGSALPDYSGYGKNTYTMVGSVIARPIEIEVTVTSPDTNAVGSASTIVGITEPMILMYEKSPLYGIRFEKTLLNTFTLEGTKEIEVLAMPFYFGVTNASDLALNYTWSINNRAIQDGQNTTSRTLRQAEGTSGQTRISLSIENTKKFLQSASRSFNLEFGKKAVQEQSTF